ncbi:HNH endonuclease [Nocardia sp. NPDC055029]
MWAATPDGVWSRPRDYTWHHHEDGIAMQLVTPTSTMQRGMRVESQ